MFIKQLSIFVENKPGRLAEITNLLKQANIDIRALSVADTKDFGILRLIVNNPVTAEKVLKDAGFTVSLTEVVAIGITDKPGGLADIMDILYNNHLSVEYMYAFVGQSSGAAYVILRVEDNEKTVQVLKDNHVEILECTDVYKI